MNNFDNFFDNLLPLRPLIPFVQSVLPTVFDDSLSYLETLGKVVKALNDTETNVNTLEDALRAFADDLAEFENLAIYSVNMTFNENTGNYTADKTFADIDAALLEGRTPVLHVVDRDGRNYYSAQLAKDGNSVFYWTTPLFYEDGESVIFRAFINNSGVSGVITSPIDSGAVVVNYTTVSGSDTPVVDKTFEQISAALEDNKPVFLFVDSAYWIPLSRANRTGNDVDGYHYISAEFIYAIPVSATGGNNLGVGVYSVNTSDVWSVNRYAFPDAGRVNSLIDARIATLDGFNSIKKLIYNETTGNVVYYDGATSTPMTGEEVQINFLSDPKIYVVLESGVTTSGNTVYNLYVPFRYGFVDGANIGVQFYRVFNGNLEIVTLPANSSVATKSIVNSDLESVLDEAVNYSRQLLDSHNATIGYYWNISNDQIVKGGGGSSAATIFDPIPVKAGVTYYCKYLYGYFCILDDGGELSRVTTDTTTAYTGSFTPENDGVVYITTANSAPNPRILTDSPYGATVTGDTKVFNASLAIDGYVHIKIANDGVSGDYTNPIAAVRNIKDASEHKQYMLDVYPGTYHLESAITSTEQQGAFWGLKLPDYVHMRGIGERDSIILDCSLPNDSPSSAVEHTSTINLNSNNTLENLTFTGTNVRYIAHDESSNTIKNWKRVVKNCKFVHNGNAEGFWAYTYAWGEGCSSGSYSYFEDCIFENNGAAVAPYGFHTNTDFENACTHIFKNCKFIQNYFGSNPEGAFMVDDIQCGKPINIEFVGCAFSRFIFIKNHNSSTDIEEINITGHGNTPAYVNSYRPNVTNPKRIFTKFSDEVSLVYNNSSTDIAMGRPLNYASFPNNKVGIPQSSGTWVCGISLDVIPANGIGYMQYSGILPLADVGVSGINIGDKVGVVDWAIAKVTDGTEFARAIQNNVIKFM